MAFKRTRFRLLPLILGFLFAIAIGHYTPAANAKTEILWDTYGVPHIYGKNTTSAFKAFGWAQMQSHGNLILRLYGQARGRAAEYWGEEYLDSDRWVQTMSVPERAQEWYALQNPTFRGYLDAFAAGINDYVAQHPDAIAEDVKSVLPVSAVDVIAHVQRVLHFSFVVSPERIAGITAPLAGSNAWAIAPQRSQSGNSMLLVNPHLPWSDLYLWYEAQITAPDIDAYGATLVGMPVLAIAFNNNLGWTHTVNTHDGWDAYELTLTDQGYWFDNRDRSFETQTKTLKIRQPDGSLRTENLLLRQSIHGPVVAANNEKAIALRVVGLEKPKVLEQWWNMARAQNLQEFEAAIAPLELPMFTIMYADREGHILHVFNGEVPVRSQGDYEYWQGVIPGDTSETLWTRIHPYEDLPRVLDPATGWLQNANDPPWTTTFPPAIDPEDYPAYMAPRMMDFRAQHSAKMLAADPQISLAEMIEYKHSTLMELSDRILDDLLPAAQQGGELARQAAEVLQRWDRRADADSRGAVLFAFWFQEMNFPDAFAIPWNEDAPLTTPDGLQDPALAVTALDLAAQEVQELYGSLDIPWGEVFRLRYGDVELPANGGDDSLGIFRALWFLPQDDDRFAAFGGDSVVAVIEFSDPVQAKMLVSYGNASQPGSQHIGDQLPLFARQELRTVWRSRPEILQHLAERQEF